MMTAYALMYRADIEGDWLREPVDRVLDETEAAARAAWARAYRGPDIYGHRAYPDIVRVEVDPTEAEAMQRTIYRKDGSVLVTVDLPGLADALSLRALVEAVGRFATLQRADLQGADLCRADLQGADLQGADLQGATLRGADLQDAALRGAHLQRADLREAHLQGADLRGADLRRADLRRADLRGADLQGALLYGADLRRAHLQGADLWGANLQGANLQGANLQDATP